MEVRFGIQDFYLYMKHYKEWPFFLENENGMLLSDYFETIEDILDKIKESQKTGIDKQLSFFVFEQLFSPCWLNNLLTAFCDVFKTFFYAIDSPKKERAINFSSALAGLPVKT